MLKFLKISIIYLIFFIGSLSSDTVIQNNYTFYELNKLAASDNNDYDYFASNIAIYDDYVIVGAPSNDDNGSNSGSAYIFKNDGDGTFVLSSKLIAPDAATEDEFGYRVAISSNYAIVGALYNDDNASNSGSVYIYKKSANGIFEFKSKLTASDADENDFFSQSVAINDSYAVVGAYANDDNGSNSGSAYIFQNDGNGNFTHKSKIIASDAAADDKFGYSIAISDGYIIVGAYTKSGITAASGSAYIFKDDGNGNFTQTSKLVASDAQVADLFASSVAISADYAIIGAANNDDNGSNSGSAYIFKNNGDGNFTQTSKLIASDATADEKFGQSVSISGNYAVVGAIGSTYIFKNNSSGTFIEMDKLSPSVDAVGNHFGESVSISNDYIVVGASYDDDNGINTGSAYIFDGILKTSTLENNTTFSFDVNATEVNSFSISGDDSNLFEIDTVSGEVTFKTTPDYDSPTDTDANNDYKLKVTANGASRNDTISLKITVTDISPKIQNFYSFEELNHLRALDAETGDAFGRNVSISGDYAIIGSPQSDDNGSNSGSAYIFKNDENGSFTQIAKLISSDATAGDGFGNSVSISSEYAIIGAEADDDSGLSSGSVYVFKKNNLGNFIESEKLLASDAAIGDRFGKSVAIDEDFIIIGAYSANTNSIQETGSAYIFKKDSSGNFIQKSKLLASDATSSDAFGWSVDISGNFAIVGAYKSDGDIAYSGSAYLFENDGNDNFMQKNKLIAFDAVSEDQFAYSVAIDGNYIVIGARYDKHTTGSYAGSAYVFENDSSGNFIFNTKLVASDSAAVDYFGISVAVSGESIVIGAYGDDGNGSYAGSAYIFKNDGLGSFNEVNKLTAANTTFFGFSVDISGNYIISGSQGTSVDGVSSGSAYIFSQPIKTSTLENNTTFFFDIDAIDATSYSISGGDSDFFNINSTGVITFKSTPDYEIPLDSDANNTYEFNVVADDGTSTDTKTLKITVLDIVDEIAPNGYTVIFNDISITSTETNNSIFSFINAEIGTTYSYTISSSNGGLDVSASGSITQADQIILLGSLSGLSDGILTLSVILTDVAGNESTASTATTTLDVIEDGITVVMLDNTTFEGLNDNNATFNIRLKSQPVDDVIIYVDSNDTTEGRVTLNSQVLTFIPAEWNQVQLITITGVDDEELDGDITYLVELNASSSDEQYEGKNSAVVLINEDNEGTMIPAIIMYLLN